MALPPDRPTEPLQPRPAVVREEYAADPGVDPAWAVRFEDRIRSLKRLLALVGVLALAGLGLAAWALLRDDDTDAGPSPERVARVSEKVDRLERRLGGASEESDTQQLEDGLTGKADAADLQALRREVRELRSAAADAEPSGSSSGDSSGAVSALDGRVDDLTEQVEELRTAAAAEPGTQP